MQPTPDALVYIVDDDVSVREALAWLLRSRRLASECFESAEAFSAMLDRRDWQGASLRQPCCLLLDVRMPGMSGLALFDRLIERGLLACMPVIWSEIVGPRTRGSAGSTSKLISPDTAWPTAS